MKSRIIDALLVFGLLSLTLMPPSITAAERQPHMEAALRNLQRAAAELQRAEHDKGGHRARAVDLTQQAIREVDAGIHFDDRH